MADKISVKVLQEELAHHAQFASPRVRLLTPESGLPDRLLERLRQFGFGLPDLRVETDVQNIADAAITCWLFQFTTVVKVRAERIEVNCTKIHEPDLLARVMLEALEAAKETEPHMEITLHGVTLNLHMKLGGEVSAADFLNKYVNAPPAGMGPTSGRGFVYYFPGHEERQTSSLIVDLSKLHPGALYAQGVVIFDAKKIAVDRVIPAAWDYFEKVGEHFDLEVKEEVEREG